MELEALTEEQLYKILTEPKHNLIAQQRALLATENVMLEFTEEAIREIARVAALANRTIENIGARRLHTCIERIIDEISFDACDYPPGDLVTIEARTRQIKSQRGAPARGLRAPSTSFGPVA